TVELEGEVPGLAENPIFSQTLVMALAERTAARVGALEIRSVVPMDPLRLPVRGFLLLFAIALGLLLVAPGALRRGATAIGRRGALGASAASEPIVGDMTLTLVYPAYSGLPTKIVPSTSGDISALRGTQIRIDTRALLPGAKGASLVVGEEDVQK